VSSLKAATWPELEIFRTRVTTEIAQAKSLSAAAQRFTDLFVERFPSVALSRVFAVLPFERLPESDQSIARGFAERVGTPALLGPKTPVLSLLGSRGALPAWNDRASSTGHLAIPLLSKELVEGAPMIAQLLADLEVDLACLDDGRPIASRRMLGSTNQCFYVSNAKEARDSRGRFIIPSQDFVARHAIDTVFGMAGAYLDGTIVVAISFTSESLDKLTVDRFPSIISHFKMATTDLVMRGAVYG
jgi:hypothetical protein